MNSCYLILFVTIITNGNVNAQLGTLIPPDHKNAFDLNLYESVLDPKLCDEQIKYIQKNDQQLFITFLDASSRTPKGMMTGNLKDLGNYYECLGINKKIPDSTVEGKYCTINLPLNQTWPSLPLLPESSNIPWSAISWPEVNQTALKLYDIEQVKRLTELNWLMTEIKPVFGVKTDVDRTAGGTLGALTFDLAVCIPKACSPRTALSSIFNGSDVSSIEFTEGYCRLPNDKPFVTADILALVIFSFIGLLVIMSTAYDLRYNVFVDKDIKRTIQINKLFLAFSVYTNTRRLVTYTPVPGTLECLDGIRSFAMMWVIIGHTFVSYLLSDNVANPLNMIEWIMSLQSIWIMSALITVDTFFMLSGLLLVYTTAGKLTSIKLLKNLHLFYLNRLLRMFPVLAAMILLQVSLLNWVVDGPYWAMVADHTHRCRVNWWKTLLYIQNYFDSENMCLPHTWYLAIDVQLHILSPIVLFWVLTGKRRVAWATLITAFIAVLAAATIYNFHTNTISGLIIPTRFEEKMRYSTKYYWNTLARASPFFVGLIFGYILHLNRGQKLTIPRVLATVLWVCAMVISFLIVYSSYPITQLDWDNQLADNMINSFMRPAWAMAVGWLIVACEHGYGGIINWLLCLRAWKVISRLSYAMYIVHYPLIIIFTSMPVSLLYFSTQFVIFRFASDFCLSLIVAFIITILIDAPCSILIKQVMGGGAKKTHPALSPIEKIDGETIEETNKNNSNL